MEKIDQFEYRDTLANKLKALSKDERKLILDKEKYTETYDTAERAQERIRGMKISAERRESAIGIPHSISEFLSNDQIEALKSGSIKESLDVPGYRNMEVTVFTAGTEVNAPDGVYKTGWVHPHEAFIVVQDKKITGQYWLRGEDGLFVDNTHSVYSAPTWAEWTDEDDQILTSGQYGNPRIEFKLPGGLSIEKDIHEDGTQGDAQNLEK